MSSDPVHEAAVKKLYLPERVWRQALDVIQKDFGPGPRCIPLNWVINLQKGGTLLFVLGLMKHFNNYGTTPTVYAALHGSYGLIWLLKEAVCPDPNWQGKVRVGSALGAWLAVLGPYWLAPYLIIRDRYEAPTEVLGAAILTYALGVVLMVGSDAQKYFLLKERKGLITNGFFARVRHPNYLGEMMLYGSFAALSGRWEPWGVLAWVWLGLFVPNMRLKEARMSRHGAWADYKKKTALLLPYIF